MKVGMIFECGPDGADKKVCEYLARKLQPDIEIRSETLDNKRNLLAECGSTADLLLKENCDRVVIIWDLYPPWRDSKPCRKVDREAIIRSLAEAGVETKKDETKVFLVCIEAELEAWLIADNRALEAVLSRPTRPVRVKEIKHPEREQNPKRYLIRLYRKHSRSYNELNDAEKIVKALPDLNKIRRCDTFLRFESKVTAKPLS
jgi:uncharacterized protein DUF4276